MRYWQKRAVLVKTSGFYPSFRLSHKTNPNSWRLHAYLLELHPDTEKKCTVLVEMWGCRPSFWLSRKINSNLWRFVNDKRSQLYASFDLLSFIMLFITSSHATPVSFIIVTFCCLQFLNISLNKAKKSLWTSDFVVYKIVTFLSFITAQLWPFHQIWMTKRS